MMVFFLTMRVCDASNHTIQAIVAWPGAALMPGACFGSPYWHAYSVYHKHHEVSWGYSCRGRYVDVVDVAGDVVDVDVLFCR